MSCAECGQELKTKDRVTCCRCSADLCLKHQYIRVDANNGAITRNAPKLCRHCYQDMYRTALVRA